MRNTIIVAALVTITATIGGKLLYDDVTQTMHVIFADDQTDMFESMRLEAVQGDGHAALRSLEYVQTYYPSGTKQSSGTKLDRVVERARQAATREIIAQLRIKTGKDFGDDPIKWLDPPATPPP